RPAVHADQQDVHRAVQWTLPAGLRAQDVRDDQTVVEMAHDIPGVARDAEDSHGYQGDDHPARHTREDSSAPTHRCSLRLLRSGYASASPPAQDRTDHLPRP